MRLFLIVLDSVGAGYLPDAGLFGDVGANTLGTLASSPELSIPNLVKMGIGNIEGLSSLGTSASPEAAVGRCIERSMGKDTIIGHWEIAGLVSPKPLPTYPNGFPKEIINAFSEKTGRGVIVNKPYSGTEVIRDYGTEHVRTGKWIVYTSADSVFQVAAHEEVIPLDELYRGCEIARGILTGDNAVGRVIARPFVGIDGDYRRTTNRRDFSLEPFAPTLLDALKENGKTVIAVGKIHDIFAGRGISESIHTDGNTDGMNKTLDIASRDSLILWISICSTVTAGIFRDTHARFRNLTHFFRRSSQSSATMMFSSLRRITDAIPDTAEPIIRESIYRS